MVNELWYEEDDEYAASAHRYLQKFIDLYYFDSAKYRVPQDITTENLSLFLNKVLRHYEQYHFEWIELKDFGEALGLYLSETYKDDFPDTNWPQYPDSDKRNLALEVTSRLEIDFFFPEDVPFILNCLNLPEDGVINIYDRFDKYLKQFDEYKREAIELPKRRKVINSERTEAIKNNEPLPIRPMSIELDTCYRVKAMIKSDYLTDTSDDEKIANMLAGYSHTPKGMSWHHLEDGVTMELLETGLHYLTKHKSVVTNLRQEKKTNEAKPFWQKRSSSMEIIESDAPASMEEISEIEELLQAQLPQDYVEFILKYNGGHPVADTFTLLEPIAGTETKSNINRFFSVRKLPEYWLLGDWQAINIGILIKDFRNRIPKDLIVIAEAACGNKICLCIRGESYGKVYLWDHENQSPYGQEPWYDNVYLINNSFNDFINSLHEYDPYTPEEWKKILESSISYERIAGELVEVAKTKEWWKYNGLKNSDR